MMSRHVVSRHVEFRVSQLNFELCVVRKWQELVICTLKLTPFVKREVCI